MELFEVIYNYVKFPFLKFCVKNNITANQITIFNHVLTLTLGCFLFSRGNYLCWLGGLTVMFINGFLDYLDGDVAEYTNKKSKFGEWIDSGFDVIIQNAVMGAIAIGCYHVGLKLVWIVMFFIANSGNNLVSFYYNSTFGFDSSHGNDLFRKFMDSKATPLNRALKNIIDPTSSFAGLVMFTFRYFIIVGALFNIMPICFVLMTFIGNFRWGVLFAIYAAHQKKIKKLYVLQALSVLDEERDEFFKLRNNS